MFQLKKIDPKFEKKYIFLSLSPDDFSMVGGQNIWHAEKTLVIFVNRVHNGHISLFSCSDESPLAACSVKLIVHSVLFFGLR